jgi:hypothetical protein
MNYKQVVRVSLIYGGSYYVAANDLRNLSRTYLPRYTRSGLLWEDTRAGQRAARKHQATTIHRENIAEA